MSVEEEMEAAPKKANAKAKPAADKPAKKVVAKPATKSAHVLPFLEHITVPSKDELTQSFQSLDTAGNGILSQEDLLKAVLSYWPKFTNKSAIPRGLAYVDEKNTGFVADKDFECFMTYVVTYHNAWIQFAQMDKTGDRKLTQNDFIQGAKGITNMTEGEIRKTFETMDNGGYVTFDDFCAVMAGEKIKEMKGGQKPGTQPIPPKQPKQPKRLNTSPPHRRPFVETTLTMPRYPPKIPAPAEDQVVELPPIKPTKKVRVTGDPVVEALEVRLRERRAKERQRMEETMRKAEMLRAQFEMREAEIQEQKRQAKMAELQAKREEFARKMEQLKELEQMRCERLAGRVKVDMDVITGKKSTVQALEERVKKQREQEEEEKKAILTKRHEICVMGAEFHEALRQHTRVVGMRYNEAQRERENRVEVEVTKIAPLPVEYRTKARLEILEQDAEFRRHITQRREEASALRAVQLDYADEVRELYKPKVTKPFVPPPVTKTLPRETMNPFERNANANKHIRSKKKDPVLHLGSDISSSRSSSFSI